MSTRFFFEFVFRHSFVCSVGPYDSVVYLVMSLLCKAYLLWNLAVEKLKEREGLSKKDLKKLEKACYMFFNSKL